MSASQEVTRLLLDWTNGNKTALDQLMPLVYDELRRLADSYLRREDREHTLQPTALVHEAYMRLVNQNLPSWQGRSHFFGVAARLMRQILVDHARSHLAAKRGGGLRKVEIQDSIAFSKERSADLLALDQALTALASVDPRKCQIVELRFFGGLSAEATAEAVGVSAVTVRRELRMAETWLHHEMGRS